MINQKPALDNKDPYKGRKGVPRNVQSTGYSLRIKCSPTTFLAAFTWKGPLNSVALSTVTHRGPWKVADGTSTQVTNLMDDRWTVKIA